MVALPAFWYVRKGLVAAVDHVNLRKQAWMVPVRTVVSSNATRPCKAGRGLLVRWPGIYGMRAPSAQGAPLMAAICVWVM